MRSRMLALWGAILLTAGVGRAQGIVVTLSPPQPYHTPPTDSAITLGRPQPLGTAAPAFDGPAIQRTSATFGADPGYVARGQIGDIPPVPINPPPPPPPPTPGGSPPPPARVVPGEEAYNCGIVNNNADKGNWFVRKGNDIEHWWDDVKTTFTGGFGGAGGSSRAAFMSDHQFDVFASPVSNPIFFEDPRALTELRPFFIWQKTPNNTPGFAGGSNYVADVQARVALTENISIVINELGWVWTNANQTYFDVNTANGFQELHLGPKWTFWRSTETQTVMALGANFELPVGSAAVQQRTGTLSISPYFSIAQNFLKSDYGSFNAMGTVGYSQRLDNTRTDKVYTSLHLDYDVGNQHKFYPLVELNWTGYTFNGNARTYGFEGSNLFNFGSNGVAGTSDLTVAIGGRYKFNENLQFGLAGEFSVLGTGRHMDNFRLTADMIIRY